MEVIAAKLAGHIQHFANNIKVWPQQAFEGLRIDLAGRHAATANFGSPHPGRSFGRKNNFMRAICKQFSVAPGYPGYSLSGQDFRQNCIDKLLGQMLLEQGSRRFIELLASIKHGFEIPAWQTIHLQGHIPAPIKGSIENGRPAQALVGKKDIVRKFNQFFTLVIFMRGNGAAKANSRKGGEFFLLLLLP